MRTPTGSVAVSIIGASFIVGGAYHFVNPRPYVALMPPYLPWPVALVAASGIAEVAGGIGVLIAPLRLLAAWGLIALLLGSSPQTSMSHCTAGRALAFRDGLSGYVFLFSRFSSGSSTGSALRSLSHLLAFDDQTASPGASANGHVGHDPGCTR